MRKFYLFTLLIVSVILSHCGQSHSAENPPYSNKIKKTSKEASIERGQYLVTLMDCNSCHTPKIMTERGPVPDPSRLLSGHPGNKPFPGFKEGASPEGNWLLFNPDLTTAIGPWGVSFSANLTPDPTGLGNWTYAQFKKAITEGKFKGMENGRMLLPPMPWQSYANLKEEDIQALFDYLQILKPVENIVPPPISPREMLTHN